MPVVSYGILAEDRRKSLDPVGSTFFLMVIQRFFSRRFVVQSPRPVVCAVSVSVCIVRVRI